MPGSLSMGSSKSVSMSSLMSGGSGFMTTEPNATFAAPASGNRWASGNNTFVKSLSSSAIVPEKTKAPLRGSSSFIPLEPEDNTPSFDDDKEMDQKMMDQVLSLAIDRSDSNDIDRNSFSSRYRQDFGINWS